MKATSARMILRPTFNLAMELGKPSCHEMEGLKTARSRDIVKHCIQN
jgi:hypothetical protein